MIIERFFKAANRPDDEPDWLVKDLLTMGGWTYFVGEAGVGKSMLLIQLCETIQNGKLFLEKYETVKRNCLYVQVDTGVKEWRHQIRSVTGKEGIAWTLYAIDAQFLDRPDDVELLRQIVWGDYPEGSPYYPAFYPVLKGMKFDIVVFDVLNNMTAQDLNTKPTMNFVLSTLAKITSRGRGEEKESVHYILVHHPNKQVKRGINAGAGYGGFSGLCGNMLTLYSGDSGITGLLTVEKTKVIAGKSLEIQREPNGSWSLRRDDYSDYSKMFEEE